MQFSTSTRLWNLVEERIKFPICKEKRLDNICIKPMLFLCVELPILIQFAYTLKKCVQFVQNAYSWKRLWFKCVKSILATITYFDIITHHYGFFTHPCFYLTSFHRSVDVTGIPLALRTFNNFLTFDFPKGFSTVNNNSVNCFSLSSSDNERSFQILTHSSIHSFLVINFFFDFIAYQSP